MTLPPGPKAPAALQTSMVVARPIPFFERCRRRFGGTFTVRVLRMGELVFISDPPSLKSLFAADRKNTIAPGRNVVLAPVLGQRSLLLLEGEEHLRRRKLMLPPFHGERMRAYEGVMEEATRREIASWPLQKPFPLHPSMQRITLEVILRAVFGVEDDQRRQALRENLVAILATTRSPRAVGLTIGDCVGFPPTGAWSRCWLTPTRPCSPRSPSAAPTRSWSGARTSSPCLWRHASRMARR